MSGWRRSAAAGLLLLAVYVGLSFLNSPRGFLGTDTGGKVATLRVMTERGTFDPDLGYWAEQWDPTGALHPIGFTTHTTSGTWVNVTTLPALWVGWQLYRVGGYRLALLVPMAGAVAACFAGLALLRRLGVGERHAWRGFWLLGLASPLAIYALDFWEHTLGVALMAWAVVLLSDVVAGRRPWAGAAGAGLLFGAAATMRTESLVYLAVAGAATVGLLTFSSRSGRQGRPKRDEILTAGLVGVLLLVGAAVPLAANEAAERAVVGTTVRSTRVVGKALGAADAPGSRLEEAATTLVGLEGSDEGLFLGALLVAVLLFAALRSDPGVAAVAVAGAGALVVLRFVANGLGFVPGLGPAWVLPAGAVARLASRPAGRPVRWFLAVVAVGATPIVLATQYRGGAAPQWAGRYLLVTGLLLAVLGWAALAARQARLQAAFAGLAVLVTFFGLAWLAVRSHDVDRAVATLEARREPVLVSDVYFLAREGGATYGDKRWLTLSPSPGGDAGTAAGVLAEAGIDRFAAVELAGERAQRFPGYTVRNSADLRLFDGVDLRITGWERSP